jgi:hypothetical protein
MPLPLISAATLAYIQRQSNEDLLSALAERDPILFRFLLHTLAGPREFATSELRDSIIFAACAMHAALQLEGMKQHTPLDTVAQAQVDRWLRNLEAGEFSAVNAGTAAMRRDTLLLRLVSQPEASPVMGAMYAMLEEAQAQTNVSPSALAPVEPTKATRRRHHKKTG